MAEGDLYLTPKAAASELGTYRKLVADLIIDLRIPMIQTSNGMMIDRKHMRKLAVYVADWKARMKARTG